MHEEVYDINGSTQLDDDRLGGNIARNNDRPDGSCRSTLNGASIRRDDDSTDAIYGPNVTTRRILRGEVAAPASAHSFLDAVRGAKAQAVAEK